MNKTMDYNNTGTAAFPIWTVWANYEDENGICQEHLSEEIARFTTKKEAEEFINSSK